MYFQIIIQGVDFSVHTLYVSLGESVLFVFFPPLLWKGCHDHPVCFLWWTYRFFLQCVLPVSEYIKSLIGRLIFPLHTFCSLNGNCDCDPTTDSIVHLTLVPRKRLGFVIPKTFPQFGYEMIIKKQKKRRTTTTKRSLRPVNEKAFGKQQKQHLLFAYAVFSLQFFSLLILFPFWFQIPHEHCSVFC